MTRWYGSNTDMRQRQDKVQRSEPEYRVLMESIPQLVWTADGDDTIRYCDARTAEYTGLGAAAWRGQSWLHLLHPEDEATARAKWQQALDAGQPFFQDEYRLRQDGGAYRWFLVLVRLLKLTGSPDTAQWLSTCTDVHGQYTLREELQVQNAALARTNSELDTFAYAASHDLKQPVQNLADSFEELKATASFHDRAAADMLSMVDVAVNGLLTTVHALTEVVQVQRQSVPLPAEPILLRPLVEEVVRAVQHLGPTAPVWELDFSALSAVVLVRANLRSMLYNLLSNAVKYADPSRPAHIVVRTSLTNGVPTLTANCA
ncbi:PAS domain-containing protein [Hymenobacter sp. HD11105]